MEPLQHVLYEGVLSDISMGRLGSGESFEFDTPVIFISRGRYEISGAIIDPTHTGNRNRLGKGILKATVHQ